MIISPNERSDMALRATCLQCSHMQRGNGNIMERSSALHIEIPEVSKNSVRKKEATITKRCLDWANSLPFTHCYKRKAGPGRKGDPDISGASHGYRIEIEMKAPGNKPTRLQEYKIEMWGIVRCISGWTDNFEGFKKIIREGLAARGIHLPQRHFEKEAT